MVQTAAQRERAHMVFVEANTQANEFARTGLASLLLLNGGAIVALAPIGSLFSLVVLEHRTAIISILVLFVVGLFCAMIGYLMGFFVNSELSLMMQYELAEQPEDEVEKIRLRHNKLRFIGIVGALAGVFCFIAGCLLSAAVLLNWI
jgi:uncharacterized protein YacL